MTDDMLICPHCGKENLPQATRCVHCGMLLDSLFKIEGLEGPSETYAPFGEPDDENIGDALNAFRMEAEGDEQPASEMTAKEGRDQDAYEELPPEEPTPAEDGQEQKVPDWLQRIRERAQQEEDASGDLAKKVSALDETSAAASQSQVDGEFTAWIDRIREQARRESLAPAAPAPQTEGEVPDWLQRVRELHEPEAFSEEEELTEAPPPEDFHVIPEPGTEPVDLRAEIPLTDNLQESGQSPETEKEPTEPVAVEPAEGAVHAAETEGAAAPEQETGEAAPAEMEAEALPEAGILPAESQAESAILPEALPTEDQIAETEALPETEPGQEAEPIEPVEPVEEAAQSVHAGTDQTGEAQILVAAAALLPEEAEEKAAQTGGVDADLLRLRSLREQADQLREMLAQEGKPPAPRKPIEVGGRGLQRFIMAALLLAAVIGTILIAPASRAGSQPTSAAGSAFVDRLEDLDAEDSVLVVLDYQAAASSELEQLAAPVLQKLTRQNADWQAITTHPNGIWLYAQLTARARLVSPPTVTFLPGGGLGLLHLTLNNPYPALFADYPALLPEPSAGLRTYNAILLLTDSGASLQTWMEQVQPWPSAGVILVISAHQEAATLLPYYDSGQIGGFLAGIQQVLPDEGAPGSNAGANTSFRAYQVGMIIMAVLLLLGMLTKAEMDSDSLLEKDEEA